MKLHFFTSTLLVIGPVLSATSAQANVQVFTDQSLFLAQITPTGTEDFESFVTDTDFSLGQLSLDGFSLTHIGSDPFANVIDALPFQSVAQNVNGSTALRGYTGVLGDTLQITFSSPIHGFGAFWANVNNDPFMLTQIAIGEEVISLPHNLDGFWGFIISTPISFATIQAGGTLNDAFGVDDAIFGVIPEVSTSSVWMGIVAFVVVARRSKFQRHRR